MAAEQQQHQAVKPGGSRFAVTCGLLRQYMKEQGGNGTMCLAPTFEAAAAPAPEEEGRKQAVLELFPQQPGTLKKASSSSSVDAERRTTAPLTIFYGGKMVVFDDFPADKAQELIKVAGGGSGNVVAPPADAGQPCLPDMPIARKVSLQRFLAKRKSRIATESPPDAASQPASKRVMRDLDGAPCLGGVNPMLSLS